ncbi:SDR family oxidoreductase [Capnocytophaga canimorsus]|uniref:SDR family oxidoreductase n=1 Tax=Capnocytophaga canimorsus TaxID=28188 RepID=UPI0037D1E600
MKLSNNTILITGGSSGIGWALAKRFYELDNKVIITGRDPKKLAQIKSQYPNIETFAQDLTQPQALDDLAAFIKENHPDLNILINNAAVQYNYLFIEERDYAQKIDYELAINLAIPMKLSVNLLPILLKNKNSAVVNVSSGLFIAPKKTASVYCATKSALHSFSQTLRYQLESTPVKVFEIVPSLIDTPMTQGRGKSKISPEKLVDEFIKGFKSNKYEIYIGKTKLLKFIHRIFPKVAYNIMKNGL